MGKKLPKLPRRTMAMSKRMAGQEGAPTFGTAGASGHHRAREEEEALSLTGKKPPDDGEGPPLPVLSDRQFLVGWIMALVLLGALLLAGRTVFDGAYTADYSMLPAGYWERVGASAPSEAPTPTSVQGTVTLTVGDYVPGETPCQEDELYDHVTDVCIHVDRVGP